MNTGKASTGRLVAVSNRVSLPRRGTAPGGLAVGLLAAMQARGGLWFGWSGDVAGSSSSAAEFTHRGSIAYATIDLSQRDHDEYYLGFANGTLWPVFHYFLESFHFLDQQYEAYQRVNQQFATALLPLLQPDDLIWVHDYHLMPLAARLRDGGASQRMGFFLHIPFPNIEVLRALPVYDELVQALLAYDVLGFQTANDLAAFHSAVELLWGRSALHADGSVRVGERCVVAGVFPIGVDVAAIEAEATAAQSSQQFQRMVAGMLGRKLLIGVDRLDYSKGLVERFHAYEKFLEIYPENQGLSTFLQIAPLSRSDVSAYSTIRRELEQASGRINGRFAETDWTPIRYLNRNFTHDVLMSFLRAALVGIVTPVRDGMNLVAKEFVAAQDPADPGVLILSNMAGAARELSTALQVNPYDSRAIAHAIHTAFAMPLAERQERHQAMLQTLRANDIHAWHSNFMLALQGSALAGAASRT